MPRSKILIVNDHSYNHSGTPRYLVDVVRFIDQDRFDVRVACPHEGPLTDELKELGVPLRLGPMTPLTRESFVSFWGEVASHLRWLRRSRIDLVHINTFGWRDSIAVAAWMLGIPVLLHVHNPLNDTVMGGNLNVKLAERLLLNADAAGRPFGSDTRLSRKFVTVYNGVDLTGFEKTRSLREELHLPPSAMVVGTVGQVCPRKGILDFLNMAPVVLRDFPDAHFLVVGREAIGHEGYLERMKQEARRLEIDDRVHFTGHRTDIPDVMKTLDVFVLASLVEPFGRVVLEAMAGGCPVVATQVGGVPEILSQPDVGILVPPQDPARMAEAVIALLGDPVRRARMGAQARAHVADRFSVERVTRDLEAVYESELERARHTGRRILRRYSPSLSSLTATWGSR